MLNIVIATTNGDKFRELKSLFAGLPIRWRSLNEFPQAPSVKETGRTFAANAIKKARLVARATGCVALADDSGLEVEALGGAPGIRSARFANRPGDDEANNRKLLRRLKGIPLPQRRARYHCALALGNPSRLLRVVNGQWRGRIALQAAGRNGFGYDPLFFLPRFGRTVGQLPRRVKQQSSHRAAAARKLRPFLSGVAGNR